MERREKLDRVVFALAEQLYGKSLSKWSRKLIERPPFKNFLPYQFYESLDRISSPYSDLFTKINALDECAVSLLPIVNEQIPELRIEIPRKFSKVRA